ncbi:GNAT family protein [Rugosimonospora acidiphila]|uniref:GNAT family protein n=1 Tax=Rugosimonospora acidiphila TaxID=556531 RepID=A0ABP9S5B5_9ACTN
MTDDVTLRPVTEDDLPLLDRLLSRPDGGFLWYGWRDPQRLRRKFAENGMLGEDESILIAALGEQALGMVGWHRVKTTPGCHYWNIGIALAPEARGHGHGVRAQRLLVEYLFAHTPVNRVEAITEVDNLAEQRSLERAGFTREGVLRGYGFRDGQWRDGVVYAVVRADLDR